jgi:hypothetical protein
MQINQLEENQNVGKVSERASTYSASRLSMSILVVFSSITLYEIRNFQTVSLEKNIFKLR